MKLQSARGDFLPMPDWPTFSASPLIRHHSISDFSSFFLFSSISLFSLWECLNFQLRDIKLVGLGIIQTNLIQFRIKELKLQVSRWVKVDHLEGLRGWACFHLKIISNWKLFPPEKFSTWKLFPLGNYFQLKIISNWKLFPPEKFSSRKLFPPEIFFTWKLFPLKNCLHLKIISMWKLFLLENCFHLKIIPTFGARATSEGFEFEQHHICQLPRIYGFNQSKLIQVYFSKI